MSKVASPPRRPSKRNKGTGGVLYAIFLIAALFVGTLFGWARRSNLVSSVLLHPVSFLETNPRDAFGGKNSETLLILGCDEDRFYHGILLHGQNIYKKYARSDMMLVAKLDFDHKTITGLSIPRDTECRIPRFDHTTGLLHGRHKINAFHELAPTKQADEITEEAVGQILPGVKIDKVVDLDFDAIEKLVDLVGGVELTVPKKMDYDDKAGELHIHLKPGFQRLDGKQAMGYVRFRHDRESDFGRQQRQKDFLTSFKQAALKNLVGLPELATQGKACLNNALDDNEILSLAVFSRSVPPDKIKMGMIPVIDGPKTTLLVDKRLLPKRLAEFGFSEPSATRESSPR